MSRIKKNSPYKLICVQKEGINYQLSNRYDRLSFDCPIQTKINNCISEVI